MTRSVVTYPLLTGDQKASVLETMEMYAAVYNEDVNYLINHSSTSKSLLHSSLYHRQREEQPLLPSALVQCARDVAVESVKAWNTARKNREKNASGKKSRRMGGRKMKPMRRPSMKQRCTMRYNVRCVTLRGCQLTFSTCRERVRTIIYVPEYFSERYPSSDGWKFKGANIGIDGKGRIFVSLGFRRDDEPSKTEGRTVGIDRGIYNVAFTSDGIPYGAKEVRRVKRKCNHVRAELQKKGTRSAKRRLKAVSGREKRFVQDRNHCISKQLAGDGSVSVYVIEDLSHVDKWKRKGERNKTMRKWLSNWSYSDLEEKLVYKCQRNGIAVVRVSPELTSQTCSVCGSVGGHSRKGNRYICRNCGASMHADHNAAINIRDRYLTQTMKSGQAAVNQPYGWSADAGPSGNGAETLGKHSRPSLQVDPEGR